METQSDKIKLENDEAKAYNYCLVACTSLSRASMISLLFSLAQQPVRSSLKASDGLHSPFISPLRPLNLTFSFPSSLRRPPPRVNALRHVTAAATPLSSLVQDGGATALVLAGAYSLVLAFDSLTKQNLIEQSLSRKVVHVLSGLLFMSSWPLFSSSMEARYFAAVVPFVNCVRLVSYGLCFVTDEGLIKSITREGKPEELLRGPMYYVLVLLFCALVFWRDSPVGILVLAMMCGGDGFADIVGRRYGSLKLPYNSQKSWAGSISMFLFGFLSSIGMLYYFSGMGFIQLDWGDTVGKVVLVSLVATVVESLPISDFIDDNISVPLSTMLAAMLVLGYVPSL